MKEPASRRAHTEMLVITVAAFLMNTGPPLSLALPG